MAIAQKRHEQNRQVIMAKASRTEVLLPEPNVRQALARAEQKKLATLQADLRKITDAAFLQKKSLAPYEYPANDLADVFKRQELRALLRELPQQDRMKLMQKHEFKRAALEMPPEVSALPATEYDRIYEEQLGIKHPDIVEGVAQADEAVKIVERVIKTAGEAVENELIASGGQIAEPAETPPQRAWVVH
jgi:hypothetical protein